jgi:hypothetical protein
VLRESEKKTVEVSEGEEGPREGATGWEGVVGGDGEEGMLWGSTNELFLRPMRESEW